MRKFLLCSAMVLALGSGAQAQSNPGTAGASKPATIKIRADHLSGTRWVLVVSYLSSEITSVTCDRWTMLGINSYSHQNDFTVPAGPAVAVMDAKGFDGYCKAAGSIRAHTDDGDFVGTLDRGEGDWSNSTKLTFNGQR